MTRKYVPKQKTSGDLSLQESIEKVQNGEP